MSVLAINSQLLPGFVSLRFRDLLARITDRPKGWIRISARLEQTFPQLPGNGSATIGGAKFMLK
jgi:hypothetical protein